MSHKNKHFISSKSVWQRHALAKACALVMAGAGVVAHAVPSDPVPPGAALMTNFGTVDVFAQMSGSLPWSTSYNSPWGSRQTQTGSISAPILNSSIGSSLTTVNTQVGFSAVSITGNRIFASGLANEAITPITTLNRVSDSDDGILSLNLQIFTGLANDPDPEIAGLYLAPSNVSGSLINTGVNKPGTVYLTQTGLSAANLSLSNNVMGANATLNTLNATVAVATPADYKSTSKGTSSLAFDSDSMQMGNPETSTAGSTSSVNLSNMQGVFNATGTAEVTDVKAVLTVSKTDGNLSSTISANSNSIAATTNNNTAVSIFRSTAESAAFTGTVGVTNLQSTNIVKDKVTATQMAQVTGSGVSVDLRDGDGGSTAVTGAVTVNDNSALAAVTGNAAGSLSSSGSIAAGNALVFEGSSNIKGVNATRGLTGDLQAAVTDGASDAKADLLINSVQLNSGNTFTATLDTTTITSKLDTLSGAGSLTQSGNTLSATATNNLAGNLISAGQTSSIGNITASSVLLNTQKNSAVTTLAKVNDAVISATVGAEEETVSGAVTLNSNAIGATAQGNLATSTVALKADNLNVGPNGVSNGVQLRPAEPSAVSGLAVSTLNVQINNSQDLTALNQSGSIGLAFADGATAAVDINGTQATVNSNQLSTTAAANMASNRITLQSTNAEGLNAGLGNLQTNEYGSTTASSGALNSPLTISMTAGSVEASELSMRNNSITALAQLNGVNNTLSATGTVTSGALALAPNAAAGGQSSGNVTAFADMALANAQTNTRTSADASSYGAVTVSTAALTLASTSQINSNQISAFADGNSATNALTLSNGSMSNMSAGLASVQTGNHADITSQAAGEVSFTAANAEVTASLISVNDNAIKATSISNSSSNSLSVTAGNATGTGLTFSPNTQSSLNAMTLVADMALFNSQTSSASNVQASAGVIGTTPALIKLTAGAVSDSANLTLNGNEVAGLAYANSAGNTGVIKIDSMTGMTAGLANSQILSFSGLAARTDASVDAALGNISSSNVSVNTNAISSAAMGNTVTNGLSITATNASGRGAQPSLMSDGETTADQALTNMQVLLDNTVVASTAGDVTLKIEGSVSGPANVNLNSNTISAYGSGNYATNDMAVAVNHLTDSASTLVSRQVTYRGILDLDSVTATATGTVILESGAVSTANLAMNGNTVKSTALDNVASNQLILSGTTATGTSGLSMTGLISPIAPSEETFTAVAADASLINLQASGSAISSVRLKANTGVADAIAISTSIDGANTGATVTVNNNAISSLVFDNNATNTLGMNVTTLTAMTGVLLNAQQVDKALLSATTMGGVSLTSTAAVDTASLTLKGNSIGATAVANEASNSFTVVATDVVGRNVSNRSTNAGSLAVAADFALGNEQQLTNTLATATAVKAASTGDVHLDVGSTTVTASNVDLNNNSLASYGSGNNASNLLSMTATNISQASLGMASKQSIEVLPAGEESVSAVASTTTGSIKITAGDVASANLSATGNTIKSTALGNVVSNTLMASASTYTGPAALEGAVGFAAGSEGTSTTADLAIANVQNNVSTATISATTSGTVQMAMGDVNLSGGGRAPLASLTGNTLKALAQSNSASNEIKLNITQLTDATAGVVSYQNSTTAVSASLLPPEGGNLFAITSSGDLTAASIVVSGNTASALAGINEAFNTLTVSGANLLGRSGTITTPAAGTASSTGADFAVMNVQSASAITIFETTTSPSAEATVTLGSSGFSTAGSFTGGSVAVTGNEVLARAGANMANNALTLSAINRLEASGVVNNVQSMADGTTVKATVIEGASISAEFGLTDGGAAVSVKDNTVTAQATGNVANNALNASASTGIASAGSTSTSPTFAVLNWQSTGASVIQSAINGITVGGAQINGALNGGSFSTSGNQIQSVAYGNSVNNTVGVSPLTAGANTASASITNVQYNMASIKASVTDVNVQGSGTVGSTGGSVNIAGNSITAMAVGNRSVNSFTGR